jgi:hypothetical protein
MDDAAEDAPWLPDEQIVDAVMAGGKRDLETFTKLDRCWIVAGLGARGMSGDDVAEKLGCTTRTIRKIRALPETRAFIYAATETANFRKETALLTSGLRATQSRLATSELCLERTREKLDRLIDASIVGTETCRRCQTPWDKVNTYYCGEKRYCRECSRRRQRTYRDRLKAMGAEDPGDDVRDLTTELFGA